MLVVSAKRCSKCGDTKPVDAFSRDSANKSGLRGQCKSCDSAKNKAWSSKNPERKKENRKRWRQENLAIVVYDRMLHEQGNKDSYRVRVRNRKRHLNTINEMEPGQWESLVRVYGGRCLYPRCNETQVTQDHVIPISKGGRHHVSNLQPLCHSHNSGKGASTQDFRAFVVTG